METMNNVISPRASPLPGKFPMSYFPEPLGASTHFARAIEPTELLVAPAVTYHQHRACSALVRRMYAWRGYRLSPARQLIKDPNHATLGAWIDGKLVATLTASRDSSAGLLADTLYEDEMAKLRKPTRVICEATQLAIDSNTNQPDLLKTLFQSTCKYAKAVFGVTDLVVEVNPRHATYYRRKFGFTQIGALRTCPRVNAPAVLMHRSLGNFSF